MSERKFVRSENHDESCHGGRSSCTMHFNNLEVTKGNYEGTETLRVVFTENRGELSTIIELPREVAGEVARKMLFELGWSV